MPCDTRTNLSELQRRAMADALKRLQQAIGAGSVTMVVGPRGSIALRGWTDEQRGGLTDLCAFRKLRNTPEGRRALMRAETMAGRQVDERVIAAGVHSHDGGATWGTH
jgi:hypothetical protein